MKIKVSLKDYNGWKAELAKLKKAAELELDVGIPEEASSDAFAAAWLSSGTPVAAYAAANEYGTKTIPSRPFMRTTFDDNEASYAEEFAKLLREGATPRQGLVRLGMRIQKELRATIKGWATPPNAPATIKAKGEDNPLVDTGTMRRSIKWQIRKRA